MALNMENTFLFMNWIVRDNADLENAVRPYMNAEKWAQFMESEEVKTCTSHLVQNLITKANCGGAKKKTKNPADSISEPVEKKTAIKATKKVVEPVAEGLAPPVAEGLAPEIQLNTELKPSLQDKKKKKAIKEAVKIDAVADTESEPPVQDKKKKTAIKATKKVVEPVAEGLAPPVAEGLAPPVAEGLAPEIQLNTELKPPVQDKKKKKKAIKEAVKIDAVADTESEPPVQDKKKKKAIKATKKVVEPVAEGLAPPVAEGLAPPVAEGLAPPVAEGLAPPVVEGLAPPVAEGLAPEIQLNTELKPPVQDKKKKAAIKEAAKIDAVVSALTPELKAEPPVEDKKKKAVRAKKVVEKKPIEEPVRIIGSEPVAEEEEIQLQEFSYGDQAFFIDEQNRLYNTESLTIVGEYTDNHVLLCLTSYGQHKI